MAGPANGPPGVLATLGAELVAEGSVVSPFVRTGQPQEAPLGALVAAGPRTAADGALYATVVECVREGYLLHYGSPRLLARPDSDLALLAGDYLYAKGLERLAAAGDLESIRELGDLISLSAQLHVEGQAERCSGALWLASTVAIAVGADPDHEAAKQRLREAGDASGLAAAARRRATGAGLDEQLTHAAEAVGFQPSSRG